MDAPKLSESLTEAAYLCGCVRVYVGSDEGLEGEGFLRGAHFFRDSWSQDRRRASRGLKGLVRSTRFCEIDVESRAKISKII